jgi:hypothetical protein
VCDQENLENEEAKARYRAVKIQPQWVVTPGKTIVTELLQRGKPYKEECCVADDGRCGRAIHTIALSVAFVLVEQHTQTAANSVVNRCCRQLLINSRGLTRARRTALWICVPITAALEHAKCRPVATSNVTARSSWFPLPGGKKWNDSIESFSFLILHWHTVVNSSQAVALSE